MPAPGTSGFWISVRRPSARHCSRPGCPNSGCTSSCSTPATAGSTTATPSPCPGSATASLTLPPDPSPPAGRLPRHGDISGSEGPSKPRYVSMSGCPEEIDLVSSAGVALGHAHAAVAQRGHGQAVTALGALFHEPGAGAQLKWYPLGADTGNRSTTV